MSFFDGVVACNQTGGGTHQWDEPERITSALTGASDWKQRCGGCGVTAWGSSPAEAMDHAREIDRANRAGRLA